MELLLVRHAEPVRIEHANGPADPHLHERGVAQARRLASWLANEEIHGIWTSPLCRARETADAVARVHDLPVTIDEELAEFDRDASFYIPVEEMKANRDPRLQALAEGRFEEFGTGDFEAFRTGVIQAMERIIATSLGGRVAVVCHGGVINLYMAHILRLDRPIFFGPDYTSISRVLAARTGERSVLSLNEAAHLRNTDLLPDRGVTAASPRQSGPNAARG
jgi:2,3-bisphosphoglycerate-dependent phosphoglycerate mutase